MCPNVASLCMYSENAFEASPEGRHGWPVTMQQVVIVLEPVRQDVKGDDTPSTLPHLKKVIKGCIRFCFGNIPKRNAHESWHNFKIWKGKGNNILENDLAYHLSMRSTTLLPNFKAEFQLQGQTNTISAKTLTSSWLKRNSLSSGPLINSSLGHLT